MPFSQNLHFEVMLLITSVREKGICLGILGYKQEIICELALGILVAEVECCIHILKYPVFWNRKLSFQLSLGEEKEKYLKY